MEMLYRRRKNRVVLMRRRREGSGSAPVLRFVRTGRERFI